MTAQPARRRRTATTNPPASGRTLTTLVLSAGAPNALLMAGTLCAVWEQGKTFDIIYSSGGSAFVGLVFASPKGKAPNEALRGLVDLLSISDPIYRLFPMNYKVFVKAGPFTVPILRWAERLKIPSSHGTSRHGHDAGRHRRLYNDLVDLWAALITPTTVNPRSQGLCAPFPWLDDVIDFAKLKNFGGEFYINAFNVTDGRMDVFHRDEIDERHFYASLAYPFIYPPVEIGGKVYIEGADVDPVNFGNFTEKNVAKFNRVRTLVLIDVLGSLEHDIVRVPKDLWDAYAMTMLVPVVSLAEKSIQYFREVTNKEPGYHFDIRCITFDIPPAQRPHVMDWSHSNLHSLFEIGYAAGVALVDKLGGILPNRSR